MSQFFAAEQLKALVRPEVILLLLAVFLGVAWLYFNQQTGDAEEEKTVIDRNLRAARDDLFFWEDNYNLDMLQTELDELRATPLLEALPSLQDVLQFRSQMVTYAAEQDLLLNTFEFSETSTTLEQGEYSTIRFSMIANGELVDLVGSLELLGDFPTSAVQVMRLVRGFEEEDGWDMSLELDVFYRDQEV